MEDKDIIFYRQNCICCWAFFHHKMLIILPDYLHKSSTKDLWLLSDQASFSPQNAYQIIKIANSRTSDIKEVAVIIIAKVNEFVK